MKKLNINTIPGEIFEIIISFYQWDDVKEIMDIILICRKSNEGVKYVKNYIKKMILKTIEQKLDNDTEFHFKMMQNIYNKKCIKCAIIDNLGRVCNKANTLPSQLYVQHDLRQYTHTYNINSRHRHECYAITCKDCNPSCYYCGANKCIKCEPRGVLKAICCGRNVCKNCRKRINMQGVY
uniref:Uncharacterized protein n=1 Tax=Mimivirus LCMiAC02 TaxID=2506609 RepID=A0A481Z357_9VIRU|nr:MAG: hypothetical protein LCMiAC02_05530 [Mimivirus LCMiAC02]